MFIQAKPLPEAAQLETQTAVARSRPKILFLAHRVPYPPNRGDRIRSFHLLRFLGQRADIHLAFLAEEPPSPETRRALGGLCSEVAAIPLGRYRRWANAAWSLTRGRTATEGLFRCRRLRRLLAHWSRTVHFDAAVIYCSSMVQYRDVGGLAGVPVLVDLVDVDSEKWFQYAAKSRGVKRWLYRIEARRLRRLEQSLPPRAKAITLVSDCEAKLYRSFCPADAVYAIPNGVDLDYFQPGRDSDVASSKSCVFVGALDYLANIDGVNWFCNEVWPEVRRRRPEATLTLVGSRPSSPICQLAQRPGIRLAGDVPDVRPYLAEAAVAIIPLRIARGIQNKVLEALAMAKAVVATPEALEGIAVEPEVHVCRAGTPAQWIETITGLLDDAPTRNRLGRAGREYVEAHHCWDRQLQPLAALLGLPADSPTTR